MKRNAATALPIVAITTADVAANNGPALHFLSLINCLSAIGHDVTALFPQIAEPPVVSLSNSIRCRQVSNAQRVGLPRALSAIPAGFAIPALQQDTVAYIRASPLTALLRLTGNLKRFSAVVVEYNGWISEEAEKLGYPRSVCRFVEQLQRIEAAGADRIRVVTDGLKDILVDQGIPSERISVIGNGTDTSVFKPRAKPEARMSLGLPLTAPTFAFLGNLWPVIDVKVMIDAFALVQKLNPEAQLLIVGDGPGAAKVDNLVQQGAVTGIHRFGSRCRYEASEIIAAADVMLAPFTRSRNERIGLSPLKIRDYAAAGRPIAATRLPGISSLADRPWIELAEPENAQSFAMAMTSHFDDDIDAKGTMARQFAVEHFGWNVIASSISNLAIGALRDNMQVITQKQRRQRHNSASNGLPDLSKGDRGALNTLLGTSR